MRSIGVPELIVLLGMFVVGLITYVLPFYLIFKKAGYPGITSLAMALPLVNILLLFWFALSEWPLLQEVKALRLRVQ
jgi:hypothetical protein